MIDPMHTRRIIVLIIGMDWLFDLFTILVRVCIWILKLFARSYIRQRNIIYYLFIIYYFSQPQIVPDGDTIHTTRHSLSPPNTLQFSARYCLFIVYYLLSVSVC
jgi:hypothetical protein